MARARSLIEFQEAFPDEAHCAGFLVKRRWPDGFVCPGCGIAGRTAALKSCAYTFECLGCRRQTSITAGTVMHRSKLPLTVWFWAAHLMSTHSNGMSARQLEDQLGITYKTAWLLTQKLRRSMVAPDRKPLEGVVEVDQAEIPCREGDAMFYSGHARKILIAGAVEVIDRDTNEPKPRRKGAKYLDTRSRRIRLARISEPSWPGESHPEPLTDPYVNLSIHTARATHRRLPSSAETYGLPRFPVGPWIPARVTRPLRSIPITGTSSLLRGSPPLSVALVLSGSWFFHLHLFP